MSAIELVEIPLPDNINTLADFYAYLLQAQSTASGLIENEKDILKKHLIAGSLDCLTHITKIVEKIKSLQEQAA